jgi:ribosome-associated protein
LPPQVRSTHSRIEQIDDLSRRRVDAIVGMDIAVARSLVVNSHLVVPSTELAISFARSSGPGGQNVNKVNSKAILRWNIRDSSAIPPEVKLRFEACFPTRISQAGEVVISSEAHRDQARNLADCYEKLRQLIQAAVVVPRQRKKSRPTYSSIQDRLANKRHKSQVKRQRGTRSFGEDG